MKENTSRRGDTELLEQFWVQKGQRHHLLELVDIWLSVYDPHSTR